MRRRIEPATMSSGPLSLGTLLCLAALSACDMPSYEGPQLQEPPRGFILHPDSYGPWPMFGHLPAVYHDAWVESLPPYSTIRINGYSGALTLVDVMAAQDSARAHAPDPQITFGPIEPLTIDGREGYGWEERIASQARGVPWVAYRAMVPYDDITYTIEFSTENPTYKSGAPETLKAVVGTFGVGETVYNWPLIALAAGLLLFGVQISRQRARRKAEQLRSINLVKVRKPEDEAEGEGAPTAAASAVAATPAGPAPPPRPPSTE
jgi:hypothetical protein